MKKLFIYVLGLLIVFSSMSMEEHNGFKSAEEYKLYLMEVQRACQAVGTPLSDCRKVKSAKLDGAIANVRRSLNPKRDKTLTINDLHISKVQDYSDNPEEWLKSYGILSASLHHEAIHLQQPVDKILVANSEVDDAVGFLVKATFGFGVSSLIGMVTAGYGLSGAFKSREDKSTYQKGKELLCGLIVAKCVSSAVGAVSRIRNSWSVVYHAVEHKVALDQEDERDADTRGFKSYKCSSCIDAMAQSREGGDLFFSSQGYLTAGQVAAIADEHRKNNHMCNIHRAWNLNKSLSPGLVQKIVSPFGKSISTFTMDKAYQV